MKASDARKLIGKPVVWLDTYCPRRGYIEREGVLVDVRGRNLLIDQMGSIDWKWLPAIAGLKAKQSQGPK